MRTCTAGMWRVNHDECCSIFQWRRLERIQSVVNTWCIQWFSLQRPKAEIFSWPSVTYVSHMCCISMYCVCAALLCQTLEFSGCALPPCCSWRRARVNKRRRAPQQMLIGSHIWEYNSAGRYTTLLLFDWIQGLQRQVIKFEGIWCGVFGGTNKSFQCVSTQVSMCVCVCACVFS